MKLTFSFSISFHRDGDTGEEQRDTALDALAERGDPSTTPPELIAGAERHSIDDDFGARRHRVGFQRQPEIR